MAQIENVSRCSTCLIEDGIDVTLKLAWRGKKGRRIKIALHGLAASEHTPHRAER